MTDRLSQIKARRAKATPGEWNVDEGDYRVYALDDYSNAITVVPACDDCINPDDNEDNVRFIAHAPADIDWLIAEVERLRSELEFAQSSLPSAASVIHQDIS